MTKSEITNAPELLEAGEKVLELLDTGPVTATEVAARRSGVYDTLRAAIAKAKGAMQMSDVFKMIADERARQDAMWGPQNHPPEKWATILGEEFGEYCEAVNESIFSNGPEKREKGGSENMLRELVHVAAVAVAAIECLLRHRQGKRGKP